MPGRFGDECFNRPKGVGLDALGDVYIASSGSVAGGRTVLECYSPAKALQWRRFGLTFCYLACLDPASDTDVFTKEEHFTLDYSQPAGRQWSYRGYTVNPWKYPDDPRIRLSPTHVWVSRLAGKRFLFATDIRPAEQSAGSDLGNGGGGGIPRRLPTKARRRASSVGAFCL